jgi:glycosyltransferase involved in cell wall biosynthesis
VVEALQAGLPVIAARWRSLPELVEHGANGLLVEPASVAELAGAMALLARDDELFARLARGARERGLEHSIEIWQRRLEGWLAELAGARPPAADADRPPQPPDPGAPLPRRPEEELVR